MECRKEPGEEEESSKSAIFAIFRLLGGKLAWDIQKCRGEGMPKWKELSGKVRIK
jgi:hypothetical protein